MAEKERLWKAVVGYEQFYEISDDGLVKSLPRPGRYNRNDAFLLKQLVLPTGYRYVNLYNEAGKKRQTYVHQALLQAFVCPRPTGTYALHWDDDKSNNTIENLRWGTPSENRLDSVRNGTHANAVKTHCPHGHPYEGDNLIIGKKGGRWCRACARENGRKQRLRMGIPPRIPAN